MKRVLLLGGYGGFGARIALRLQAAGLEVMVAGRSQEKAEAFCAGRPGLVPVKLDRHEDLVKPLLELRPWAVIDAAGPFQESDYKVPEAAIAAGAHYLDIADGRDFVIGIRRLDSLAQSRGISVVSGVSSLPALSGAVVRHLATGMDEVRSIEIALSASSRGTAGRSVASAILSYLGQPIRIWRGGRWTMGIGWQGIMRQDFQLPGAKSLRRRWVALADVPDLQALPELLPGRPAVSFRAGTDRSFHNLGLWLLSWPVRWRWLRGAAAWAPFLSRVQRATRWGSSRRSAMAIRLRGFSGVRRLERRWTLIAEKGEGPEIPALAVPALLDKLRAGKVPAGARDAVGELVLEDFDPAFSTLAIRHSFSEAEQPPALYERIMRDRFKRLPLLVRQVHSVFGDAGASGRGTVTRGSHPLARLAATLFRFPDAGESDLHVAFEEEDGVERWTRNFSGHCFSSRLSEWNGLLVERFGLLRFGFHLPSDACELSMVFRRWWLGPLPLPRLLAPRTQAREWEEEGRFQFDVSISLPLAGLVVRYRGWLLPSQRI